jgi:hypothetical protein
VHLVALAIAYKTENGKLKAKTIAVRYQQPGTSRQSRNQ